MQLIDSGKQTAAENMRLDEQLLEELDPYGFPILRFYEFSAPAATYGYFLKPEEHLREGHGLDLARRPTGGGDFIPSMGPNLFSLDTRPS